MIHCKENEVNRAQCSVLVSSCDSYSDLWIPFFTLFFKHWPDCPYPVYLGSETSVMEHPRVTTLLSHGERVWSNCLLEHLQQIDTPYVLLFLEDFFLRDRVDTQAVGNAFSALVALKGKMMRIGRNKVWASRGIHGAIDNYKDLAAIKPGYPCRITLQVSFWERDSLIALCHTGESIWQFESNGSKRSWQWKEGFYCTLEPIIPYKYHVVERGEWLRHQAKMFSKLDIGCDFSKRPLMSRKGMIKWWLLKIKSHIFRALPSHIHQFFERVISLLISKINVFLLR